jgi:hypothetical protein
MLAELLDMVPLLDRRTEGFSTGERMKVALARALIHDPRHLVLDEPTSGLDVMSTRALRRLLGHLRSKGKCIVLSSHIMSEVEQLADRIVIVAHGRSITDGPRTDPARAAPVAGRRLYPLAYGRDLLWARPRRLRQELKDALRAARGWWCSSVPGRGSVSLLLIAGIVSAPRERGAPRWSSNAANAPTLISSAQRRERPRCAGDYREELLSGLQTPWCHPGRLRPAPRVRDLRLESSLRDGAAC